MIIPTVGISNRFICIKIVIRFDDLDLSVPRGKQMYLEGNKKAETDFDS